MNRERIRVLKFLNVFAIGGTERQFVNIVKRLDPNVFDLHIACFRKWGQFLPEVEACGWPLHAFQINGMINHRTFRTQLQFARYLRRHRIQVVHTYGWYPNVFAIPAAKLAGVPVTIASIRDTGAHQTRAQLQVQRIVCRMAKCILANSEAVRSWLVSEGYDGSKIHVIYNGIAQADTSEASDPPDIRKQYGIESRAPVIATICRLNPVKGVDDFLQAAAMVTRTHPDARFLVIGDGAHRDSLAAQTEQLGVANRVVFTGFRTDIAQILPQLTLSVLASLTEGFSNTLLESMAAGVPVVATRVGGNPEIVADGTTGILVPPRNPEALKEAICRLLSNPQLAQSMGSSGKERIRQNFSVESAVRRTEQLYTDLMASRALAG